MSGDNSKHCLVHVYEEYFIIDTKHFVHNPIRGKEKRTSTADKNKAWSRYSRKKKKKTL